MMVLLDHRKIKHNKHTFLLPVLVLIGLVLVCLFLGVNPTKADSDKSSNDKDNVLIYANKNGEARGYDLLWKQSDITGTYYQESAIVHKDGVIYLTSAAVGDLHPGNRDIFALDASDGSIINKYTIGSSYGSPVIDGNNLYIGSADESWDPDTSWTGEYGLYSFDISNIRSSGFVLNWFHADSAKIAEPAVYDENKVYYSQFEGNKVVALNKNDGSLAWTFTTGGYGAFMMLLHDNAIYTINSYYGARSLFKIDATTGLQIWAKPVSNYAWDNSITFDGDNNALYFAMYYAGANSAASYDLDGNLRWQKSLNCGSLSFTAYHNNVAFFSDTCGYVYALDSADGDNVWGPIRLGNGVSDQIDISSVTISGGQIFIGTTNSSKPNDSRGLGKFFILDELTGEILWQYREADLGNVMAPASIFNGIFYNITSNWDVFAFDVGDGGSDWLNPRYDKNNTGYSPGGLTQSKYVKSICSSSDTNTICNINNLYSGRAVETKLKMEGENIESVMLNNGDYHINVDGSVVYLPTISAGGELKGVLIKSGTDSYDTSIPRLTNILPTTANILSSTFSPASKSIKLSFDNTSSISATINSFKQPFLNVTNTISDENQTSISASGLSGYTEVSSVPMEITPSTGSVDVSISAWQTDGVQKKTWSEDNQTSNTFINHTVFNLDPNEAYVLKIDETSSQIKTSDNHGTISFSGGPAAREFELLKYISDDSSGVSASQNNTVISSVRTKTSYSNNADLESEYTSLPISLPITNLGSKQNDLEGQQDIPHDKKNLWPIVYYALSTSAIVVFILLKIKLKNNS